ncbi:MULTISPECIES: MutS-related protein [Clostridium]|jgi:hypothetical protein|uniref:DNA mismatch repair proteins mutS family domain-containing protein n=2 Tax=Clostridium TaxID=1485 RepID=A0ABV4E0R7_9CLOT
MILQLKCKKSDNFTTLQSETEVLKAELATVHYCMLIKGTTIKVQKYDDELALTPKIEKVFQRFACGAAKFYTKDASDKSYSEHVEAGVLNLVAKLYPNIFLDLSNYCIKNMNFVNQKIFVFSREIQFYIAYLEYIKHFKRAELSFCYPHMSLRCKEVNSIKSFDLALADKLIAHNQPVICNDFYLKDRERVIVVSGPNQGGKTTFARTFGQLHYFGSLGCPVPGKEAQLFLFDNIYTHFEREENIQNLSGKLQDDLIRMHDILEHATKDSIIIINEILSSTTLKDAVAIGEKIMDSILQLDSLCIWVTFLDELASYNKKIVSMISTVLPEDPARRTYKIVRGPADGLAYAII